MRIFMSTIGALIALICAFLLGAYLLGGSLGQGKLTDFAFMQTKPAAPAATGAAPQKPVFPRMQLQAQYAGPFTDTVIQRWRDPIDGRICYIYLPVTVKHEPSDVPGYLDYGSNQLGALSCGAPGAPLSPPAAPAPKP